jgi:hypothetical protein
MPLDDMLDTSVGAMLALARDGIFSVFFTQQIK